MLLYRACCAATPSKRAPYRCLKVTLLLLAALLYVLVGDGGLGGGGGGDAMQAQAQGGRQGPPPPLLRTEGAAGTAGGGGVAGGSGGRVGGAGSGGRPLSEEGLQAHYGEWLSEPPPDHQHCLGPQAFPKDTPSYAVSVASSRKYVMPNCEGGIGNQVFCAAAALAYALEHGRCLVLSKIWVHPSSRDSVSYRDTVFRNLWLQSELRGSHGETGPPATGGGGGPPPECTLPDGKACPFKDTLAEVVQPGLSMHWAPFTAPSYPDYWVAVLMGGWQNFWYTWRWRATIAAYLRPPPAVVRHLLAKYPDLGTVGVALHFRRGDFIKSLPQYKYVNRDFPTASDFYYQQALDLLLANLTGASAASSQSQQAQQQGGGGGKSGGGGAPPRITFFILTNDPEWAKANPWIASLPGPRVFVEEDEVYTWYVMMLARLGLICPNSTYCWWAAYIGLWDRFLTLPNHWYNSPGQEPTGIHFPGATVVHSDNARGEGPKPYYPRPWHMSDPDAGTKEEAWPSPEPIVYPLSPRYAENRVTHKFINEASLFSL
jgi:hypothetical protein